MVTAKDIEGLGDRLNAVLGSGDVDQFVALLDPDSYPTDEARALWSRRFDNFKRLPMDSAEWYVGKPSSRTRNGSGGQIEYSGTLVFAYQVTGCDAQQVVETYSADFRKKNEDASLELLSIGDAKESYVPALWDVAKIDVIETDHACIGFRLQDASRARECRDRIERGAARAFSVMPDPKGVSKVFYALSWPAIDGKLFGGQPLKDRDAYAYMHHFVDPMKLANGQVDPTAAAALPKATGRVCLHRQSLDRADLAQVATHEAVHVLANQWGVGSDTPTWAIEGLAKWGEEGGSRLLAREGGAIRSYFPEFQIRALKGYNEFQKHARARDMYMCAGAVYAYLESLGGKDEVLKVAKACYTAPERKQIPDMIGRSEQELFAETRDWLNA